jgi:hypothetical protein
MNLPRVRHFCCFDLRCGSFVIAFSELAYAILGLIYFSRVAVSSLSEASEDADRSKPGFTILGDGLARRECT